MWMFYAEIVVILLISRLGCRAEIPVQGLDKDYEDLLKEVSLNAKAAGNRARSVDGVERNKKLALAVLSNKMCADDQSSWKCKKDCRMEFYENATGFTNYCHQPPPNLQCFGIPINYSFVSIREDEHFPQEYTVLRHFPRCWKALAPLMCLSIYRPCAYHKFYQKSDDGTLEEGVIELWARIRRGYCSAVTSKHCSDVVKLGGFPTWIDCEEATTVEIEKANLTSTTNFFSSTCRANMLPIRGVSPGDCPFPLVGRQYGSSEGEPVLDSCYLPCRSSQVKAHDREYQTTAQIVIGTAFALVFATQAIYLGYFSYIYTRSLIVFCMTHSLFSISVYLTIWALAGVERIADMSECTLDGLRRQDMHQKSFDWCVWQSWLLQTSLMCAFVWLLAHFMFSIIQPSFSDYRKLGRSQLRGILILCIYFPIGLYSIGIMWSNMRESDGISGVCHVGLLSSFSYSMAILLPILLVYIPSALYAYIHYIRYRGRSRRAAVEDTRQLIRDEEEGSRNRRFQYATKVLGLSESEINLEKLRSIDWNDVLKAEEEGRISMEKKENEEKLPEKRNSRSSSVFERRRSMLEDNFDSFLELKEETVVPADELRRVGVDALANRLLDSEAPLRFRWQYSVWHRWTVASIVVAVVCLLLSAVLHPLLVGNDPNAEVANIEEYIRCGVNFSLSRAGEHWLPEDVARLSVNLTHPVAQFGTCELENPYGTYRADGVILVFLILPSLPFLVLFVAFAAGCSSHGGMKKVRELRPDWSSFCCEVGKPLEDEVEMQLIPFSRDENSERKMTAGTSFPLADVPRFASSEKLPTKNSPEPAVLNESTSEPAIDSRSERDSHVRRLDLMSRMQEYKRRRRESDNQTLKRKLNGQGIRMSAQEAKLMQELQRRARGHIPNVNENEGMVRTSSLSSVSTTTSSEGTSSQSSDIARIVRIVQESAMKNGVWAEKQRIVVECLRDLSAYINYSNDMVTNDTVAWTLVLDMLNRIDQTLHLMFPEGGQPQGEGVSLEQCHQVLQLLHEEMAVVIPTLQNHTRNLTPWANAMKESLSTIRCATSGLRGNTNGSQSAKRSRQSEGSLEGSAPVLSLEGPKDEEPITKGKREYPRTSTPLQPVVDNRCTNNSQTSSDADRPSSSTSGQNGANVSFASFGAFSPLKLPPQVLVTPATPCLHGGRRLMSRQSSTSSAESSEAGPSTSKTVSTSQQSIPTVVVTMASTPSLVEQPPAQDSMISAYTESYSASPLGILTRLSDDEIRLRVTRLREISSERLFPQEITYILALTGDFRIISNRPPEAGDRMIRLSAIRPLLGDSPAIDARHSPGDFLSFMRRRALTMVAAIGFHFGKNGRSADEEQRYHPPVLPGLGLVEMENELVLGRILGADSLLPIRQLLRLFENGRQPISHRPDLPLVNSFISYLDQFCAEQGFPVQREEFVPDPEPNQERAGEWNDLSDEELALQNEDSGV